MIQWLLRAASDEIETHDVQGSFDSHQAVQVRMARWLPVIAGRLSGMRAPAAAVTFGRTIIIHPNVQLTNRLLQHELAHVRQWQRYPLTFPARYVINHLRYGYIANPFEIEARAAEHSGGRFD